MIRKITEYGIGFIIIFMMVTFTTASCGKSISPDPDTETLTLPNAFSTEPIAEETSPESSITTGPASTQESSIVSIPVTTETKAVGTGNDIINNNENTMKDGTYILSDSDKRKYGYLELSEYLEMLNTEQVALARNEIYARHGHIFDTPFYRDFFLQKSWYQAIAKVGFDDLNIFEKYNSSLLLFVEKGFTGPVPPGTEYNQTPENPEWLDKKLLSLQEYSIDLDGDGKMETVSWINNPGQKAILKVNDIQIEVSELNSGNWADFAAVVDLNPQDTMKEIIIGDWGPSSDEWSYYYMYNNGRIDLIGETAGYFEFGSIFPDGKGGIVALTRASVLQTWFFNKKYVLDKNHRIVHVPVEYNMTAYPVFLKHSIHLSDKPSINGSWIEVPEGQAVLLSATDNKEWCRLTLENGLMGWFIVKDFNYVMQDGLYADEIFENLCNAD